MHPSVDLRLVLTSLRQLSATPYFNPRVREYSNNLCRAIVFALSADPGPPPPTLRALAQAVWLGHAYLSGSISREAPYEVQFCLSRALEPWAKKECLMTTALRQGQHDFHFYDADPWLLIQRTMPGFDTCGFDPTLVLIGLPRLYRHKPIFSIPLYHELGHFVDRHWGITALTALLAAQRDSLAAIPQSHWGEYFADIFAAMYVGDACVKVLQMIAPDHVPSSSHPATKDRTGMVESFLNNRPDDRLSALQASLQSLGAPLLQIRFEIPNINAEFDDLRPYALNSDRQLHGLLRAAWGYFERSLSGGVSTWPPQYVRPEDRERIINDLTEKSIRNYAIRRMWSDGAS